MNFAYGSYLQALRLFHGSRRQEDLRGFMPGMWLLTPSDSVTPSIFGNTRNFCRSRTTADSLMWHKKHHHQRNETHSISRECRRGSTARITRTVTGFSCSRPKIACFWKPPCPCETTCRRDRPQNYQVRHRFSQGVGSQGGAQMKSPTPNCSLP